MLHIAQQRLAGTLQLHRGNRDAGSSSSQASRAAAAAILASSFATRGVLDQHLGRRQPLLDVGRAPGRVALAHRLIERSAALTSGANPARCGAPPHGPTVPGRAAPHRSGHREPVPPRQRGQRRAHAGKDRVAHNDAQHDCRDPGQRHQHRATQVRQSRRRRATGGARDSASARSSSRRVCTRAWACPGPATSPSASRSRCVRSAASAACRRSAAGGLRRNGLAPVLVAAARLGDSQ